MDELTVAQRIARINAECSGVWAQSGIDSWERARLEEWKTRTSLSSKQMEILQRIEKKAFPDDGSDA